MGHQVFYLRACGRVHVCDASTVVWCSRAIYSTPMLYVTTRRDLTLDLTPCGRVGGRRSWHRRNGAMRDRGSNLSRVPENRASETDTLMQFGRIIGVQFRTEYR